MIMLPVVLLCRKGRYHNLYIKEFIDRNSEACDLTKVLLFVLRFTKMFYN